MAARTVLVSSGAQLHPNATLWSKALIASIKKRVDRKMIPWERCSTFFYIFLHHILLKTVSSVFLIHLPGILKLAKTFTIQIFHIHESGLVLYIHIYKYYKVTIKYPIIIKQHIQCHYVVLKGNTVVIENNMLTLWSEYTSCP